MAAKKGAKKAAAKPKKLKPMKARKPSERYNEALRAFRDDVAKLAVLHGLTENTADVDCRWEYRLEDGEMVLRWVCR